MRERMGIQYCIRNRCSEPGVLWVNRTEDAGIVGLRCQRMVVETDFAVMDVATSMS